MTAPRTNFQGVKQGGDAPERVALAINSLLLGKLNNTLAVTLRASQTTTVITDPRINATSVFLPNARTASAKLAEYGLYPSAVSNGSVTFSHASTPDTDKLFVFAIFS